MPLTDRSSPIDRARFAQCSAAASASISVGLGGLHMFRAVFRAVTPLAVTTSHCSAAWFLAVQAPGLRISACHAFDYVLGVLAYFNTLLYGNSKSTAAS